MIQIITDSLCDIRQEEAKALGVTVLPLYVIFEGTSYFDGVTITREEFYERLESGKQLPTTSQVSPESFASVFEAALAAGDDVLCLAGSSGISGTYQSAIIARDMQAEPERVYVLDTLNATVGQALLVHEAVRLRAHGLNAAAILENLSTVAPRIRLVGQVENLKHLVRGGRLNATTARVGTMLHLKPTLRLTNGKISQDGLQRGHRRVLEWFCSQLQMQAADLRYSIYIASGNAPESLEQLKRALLESGVPADSVTEMGVGCVIGTHTGAGCLAMAWVEEEAQ